MVIPATQLIAELSVSRQTLWRWRNVGAVPSGAYDSSGKLFFSQDEADTIRGYHSSLTAADLSEGGHARGAARYGSSASDSARTIYLDSNATTSVLPEVRQQIECALWHEPSNASSSHSSGEFSRNEIARAREAVGALVGARQGTIVFTSSGTEANNLAMLGHVLEGVQRVVAASTEHSSLSGLPPHVSRLGVTREVVPVLPNGQVCLESVAKKLRSGNQLLCTHWVNGETGVIQPVEDLVALCTGEGAEIHLDGAQAVGKIPIDLSMLKVGTMSMVGHKIHAPAGVGVLYVNDCVRLSSHWVGGDQEQGLRPGTENLLGIVGIGAAAAVRAAKLEFCIAKMRELRDRFESSVLDSIPDLYVNGGGSPRVCNTSNLRFRDVDGPALVARLDQRGVRVSQGSACTSGRPTPSHVLLAMGLSERAAYESIRFSFSEENTIQEVDSVVNHLRELCKELRGFRKAISARYRSQEAK